MVDVGFEHPFDRLALAQLRLQTLGVVLGRAVAHEIGHYLLGGEHARAGLMRSTFDPREFVDVRDRIFQLDHVDASRLTDALHDYLVRDLVDPIAPVADCGWP